MKDDTVIKLIALINERLNKQAEGLQLLNARITNVVGMIEDHLADAKAHEVAQ